MIPSPDRAFRIIGVFSVRSFFTHSGALWGGGLRVAEERFKTVGWTLDALVESGEVTTSVARFQVYTGDARRRHQLVPSLALVQPPAQAPACAWGSPAPIQQRTRGRRALR